RTGKLIGFLPVLSPALAVPLPGDRRIPTPWPADPAAGEHDVDRSKNVVDPVAMLLHAAGVHEEAGLGRRPPFGRLADCLFGDAGPLRSFSWRPVPDGLGDFLETDRVIVDELVVEPVVFDHLLQDASEQGRVSSGLDRKYQVARPGDRGDARVHVD